MEIQDMKSSSEDIKYEFSADEYSEAKVQPDPLDPFGWLKEEPEEDPLPTNNSSDDAGTILRDPLDVEKDAEDAEDFNIFWEENDSDDSDLNGFFAVDDSDTRTAVSLEPLHRSSGLPVDSTPWEYFRFVFPDEWLDLMVKNANENAQKIFPEHSTPAHKKYGWKTLTRQEFLVFLGLCCMMTIVKIPRLNDYWKKSRFFSLNLFDTMPFWRFQLISRALNKGQGRQKKPADMLLLFRKLLQKSYNLYCKFSSKYVSLYDFKMKIIDKLVPKVGDSGIQTVDEGVICLHFPSYDRYLNNRKKQKNCRVCWKKKIRKQVNIYCPECEGQPGLCLEDCFKEYHGWSGHQKRKKASSIGVKVIWEQI